MVFFQSWMTLNVVIGHTMNAQWLPLKNDTAINVYWIINLILATAPVIVVFYFGISINFEVYHFKKMVKTLVISSNNITMDVNIDSIDNHDDGTDYNANFDGIDNINGVNVNKKFDDWRSYVMIENTKLNFQQFGFQITYTLVFKTILSFVVTKMLSLVLEYWVQTH